MKHSRQAEFAESSISSSLSLLMDPETRVRAACGDCLGQAASILGAKAWNLTEKPILDVINYCWVRQPLDILARSGVRHTYCLGILS